MLCSVCHNILNKVTKSTGLTFECKTCGSTFPSKAEDTKIYTEGEQKFEIQKSGRDIFEYPANPKVLESCKKCKAEIVAWELDHQGSKVFGCMCGNIWKH